MRLSNFTAVLWRVSLAGTLLFSINTLNCHHLQAYAQRSSSIRPTSPANPTGRAVNAKQNVIQAIPNTVKPSIAKSSVETKPLVAPNVNVFLKTGDEIKGQLLSFQPPNLLIKTGSGIKKITLFQYHGMILDIPQEKVFGDSVTHNEDVFMAALEYARNIRPIMGKTLQANLNALPDVCKPVTYPIIHLALDKTGKVISSNMITRSNCAHLNLAMAQTIRQTAFPAMPAKYPINIYVLNYFFPLDSISAPKNKPTAAAPGNPAPAKSVTPAPTVKH